METPSMQPRLSRIRRLLRSTAVVAFLLGALSLLAGLALHVDPFVGWPLLIITTGFGSGWLGRGTWLGAVSGYAAFLVLALLPDAMHEPRHLVENIISAVAVYGVFLFTPGFLLGHAGRALLSLPPLPREVPVAVSAAARGARDRVGPLPQERDAPHVASLETGSSWRVYPSPGQSTAWRFGLALAILAIDAAFVLSIHNTEP